MARTPSWDNSGLKKGTWTPEEDRKLVAYVTRYGSWNWRQLPRFAGLARCGKSCRLRWLNYLRPNLKRGNFTQKEEETIIKLHQKLGNKWSIIATHLPGRTDNEIKNHWHTTLKKRFGHKAVHTKTYVKAAKSNGSGSNQDKESIQNNGFFHEGSPSPTISRASDPNSLSPELSSSEFSSTTSDYTINENLFMEDGFDFLDALEDLNQNISTEPLHISNATVQNNDIDNFHGSDKAMEYVWAESPLSSYNENLVVENDDFGFLEAIQPITENSWTEAFVADMSLIPNEFLVPLVNESESYFSSTFDAEDLWSLR